MRRVHHDIIDSTNAEAQRLAQRGTRGPLLITATRQSAGRGRSGREWQSPAGGAWMSVLWPAGRGGEHYVPLPLVAGVAVRRVIAHCFASHRVAIPGDAQIKWPNDILINGKKVCGILCETVYERTALSHLIIGVGINVDFPLRTLHGHLRHPPTTLKAVLGKHVPVETVVADFHHEIEMLLNQHERDGMTPELLWEIRQHLAYVGSTQTWRFGSEEAQGVVEGIDHAGRLLLNVDGVVRSLDHGELSQVPSSQLTTLV